MKKILIINILWHLGLFGLFMWYLNTYQNPKNVFIIGMVYLVITITLDFILHCSITRKRNFDEKLKEELAKRGLIFLSSSIPKVGDTGPFSPFTLRFSLIRSRILGAKGENHYYRKVICQNQHGKKHEVWAQIYTVLFRVYDIKWQPTLDKLNENASIKITSHS